VGRGWGAAFTLHCAVFSCPCAFLILAIGVSLQLPCLTGHGTKNNDKLALLSLNQGRCGQKYC
jgi:hypothetical protein